LSAVFTTGERRRMEERFATPSGEIWFEAWLVPMLEGSAVRAVMGVARDVTQRKVLERQFLQSQKMEAVGLLAGGIAHDFNNLLTAILGYSELLRDRLKSHPDALADVDEITRAGERASRLTRQLLTFSRKQPMARQVIDLNAVIADIQKMLRRVLGEDINLSFCPGDTSDIVADPSQIEQILLNLAVNARDAMPKGGSLTVGTSIVELDRSLAGRYPGAEPGRYASLTVCDTGSGMSDDVLSHVFEPFFTTKPVGKGTGLGLSTVYGIVKQNDAYISVNSAANVGTSFTVLWPRRDGASEAATPASASRVRSRSGHETILLVEDDPGIRTLMRRTLEPCGYRILEAHDVWEAIDLSATHKDGVDLLLSDVVMPGLNGPDLAQRIITQQSKMKVLYVSGFPLLLSDRTRSRVAFLAKPFTPEALVTKVRDCFDGAGAVLETRS
jgi:signal transduction histidine kinase/CheY-like chemotaxis protein